MKKIIASLLASAALTVPVLADPLKDNEYFTSHSMGCMLLQECTDGVEEVFSIGDIAAHYPDSDFSVVTNEFHRMLVASNQAGVKVF